MMAIHMIATAAADRKVKLRQDGAGGRAGHARDCWAVL